MKCIWHGQKPGGPTGFAFAPSAEEANRLVKASIGSRVAGIWLFVLSLVSIAGLIVRHVEADEPERHKGQNASGR
jgi:hypothetical protein